MERRFICFEVIIITLFIHGVHTRSRQFTCGIIGAYSAELKAIKFAVNKTSSLSNFSISLKTFSVSEKTNLYNQASALLQQNVVALIEGSLPKMSACALSTVTGIPLIRLHGNKSPFHQCEKVVQMSAGYKDYVHASLAILNKFRWEKIALVLDANRFHEAWYFHTISQSSKHIVRFVQLSEQEKTENPVAPILTAVEQIKNLEPEVILLYSNKQSIELILRQNPCRSWYNHTWIVQGQVPLNLTSHPNNIVLAMKLPFIESSAPEMEKAAGIDRNNTNKELVARAYDAVQVIKQALNREPCSSMNASVVTSRERDAMLKCMRKLNLRGVTGSIQFNDEGERKAVDLEILNLQNNSFEKIGDWNSTKGAILFDKISRNMETLPSRRSLAGRHFKVVVAETAPFLIMDKQKDGTVTPQGYCIDLLKELARSLKFTFDIYLTPDGKYGAIRKNGSWNGMIGELVNEHADLIVADLTITESREKVVDFTVPFMYYTEDILMKKTSSKNDEIDLLQFMNPFHSDVWFATLVSLVVISVAVFVINYFSPYGYKGENGRGTSEKFSFSNSVWFALACMLQQGAENSPRNLSGRILAGCYWFCILISISTYTANLAAFFTVKNAEQPIHNLEDVIRSTYQVAVVESSSTYEAFKTSQYETHRKIWYRMQTAGTITQSTSEGIRWVRERKEYLFITDGPVVRQAANQPPCDLTTVPGLTTAKGLALALQANDPHTNEFTLAILRLHENYFLDNLKRKWWEKSNGCPQEQETTLSRMRIDLTSMLGVYVVLGVGIVVAFLTLFAEILWKRKAQLNLKKKTRRPKIGAAQIQLETQTT